MTLSPSVPCDVRAARGWINAAPRQDALIREPPHPACEIAIAVPARDEAATIGATIAALGAQRTVDARPLAPDRYEVIILANNCRDDTAAVARRAAYAARHRAWPVRVHVVDVTLAPAKAHSGGARQLAMNEAWRRLATLGGGRRVVATTDADTVVAPDWIAQTLAEVARGADAVGGRVVADSLTALSPAARATYLYDVGYRHLVAAVDALIDPVPHDPWPRHHQYFGASLAVTAAAYARVGGLPTVEALEDVHLYAALVRAGLRVRHSPRVRVRTSARACGHARVGLATQIAEWATAGAAGREWRVPSAAYVESWARTRAALRRLAEAAQDGSAPCGPDAAAAARALGITPLALRRELVALCAGEAFIPDGAFRERFSVAWRAAHGGSGHEEVRRAVRALRVRVAALRATSWPR